jgi:hypothetical protein
MMSLLPCHVQPATPVPSVFSNIPAFNITKARNAMDWTTIWPYDYW